MDRRIELIISKIETETASSWDTRTLAQMVDLSPSRFRHLFKQETGSSPAQYRQRFSRAKGGENVAHDILVGEANFEARRHSIKQSLCTRFQEDVRHDSDGLPQDDLACGEDEKVAQKEVVATFGKI